MGEEDAREDRVCGGEGGGQGGGPGYRGGGRNGGECGGLGAAQARGAFHEVDGGRGGAQGL